MSKRFPNSLIILLTLCSLAACQSQQAQRTPPPDESFFDEPRRQEPSTIVRPQSQAPTVSDKDRSQEAEARLQERREQLLQNIEDLEIAGQRLAAIRGYRELIKISAPADQQRYEQRCQVLMQDHLKLSRRKPEPALEDEPSPPDMEPVSDDLPELKEPPKAKDKAWTDAELDDYLKRTTATSRLMDATMGHSSFLAYAQSRYGAGAKATQQAEIWLEQHRQREAKLQDYLTLRRRYFDKVQQPQHADLQRFLEALRGPDKALTRAQYLEAFARQEAAEARVLEAARVVIRVRAVVRNGSGQSFQGFSYREQHLSYAQQRSLAATHRQRLQAQLRAVRSFSVSGLLDEIDSEGRRQADRLSAMATEALRRPHLLTLADLKRGL